MQPCVACLILYLSCVAEQMVKEVEKAIRNSPLKLNPMAEGEVLRVPIPK